MVSEFVRDYWPVIAGFASLAMMWGMIRANQKNMTETLGEFRVFINAHNEEHKSIAKTITETQTKVDTLERSFEKDHERIRDLQIASGTPREPSYGGMKR